MASVSQAASKSQPMLIVASPFPPRHLASGKEVSDL